jgi:hypothetical protein
MLEAFWGWSAGSRQDGWADHGSDLSYAHAAPIQAPLMGKPSNSDRSGLAKGPAQRCDL